jgi:hypothetical protein
MTTACPKCGYRRQPSDSAAEGECPRCGIVFAKYQPRTEAVRRGDEDAGTLPSPLTLEGACGAAAAAAAALLMVKGMASGVRATDALLLVPFFFCFVPVLTYTFGEGLYLWNKHKMRFDLYDSDEHPVLSKAFYAFFMAASVVFAIFLFKLGK